MEKWRQFVCFAVDARQIGSLSIVAAEARPSQVLEARLAAVHLRADVIDLEMGNVELSRHLAVFAAIASPLDYLAAKIARNGHSSNPD
jgi:hypothetical protein